MFYLSMCKNSQKTRKGEKKNTNGKKNGSEVVQGLYLRIERLKRKSVSLRWVRLVVSMNKVKHGWAEPRRLIRTDPGLSQCALLRFFLHVCTKVQLDPEQVNDTRSISTHKNSIYTLLTITKPIIYCCRGIIVVSLKYLLKVRIKPQTSLSILHRKRQFIITKHSKWKQWIEFNYIHEWESHGNYS